MDKELYMDPFENFSSYFPEVGAGGDFDIFTLIMDMELFSYIAVLFTVVAAFIIIGEATAGSEHETMEFDHAPWRLYDSKMEA